jgi:hypothetical protein
MREEDCVKKILLLGAVLTLAIVGCGSASSGTADTGGAPAAVSLKDKLVGKWTVDVESIKSPMFTPEVMKSPKFAEVKVGLAKLLLEFKSDGTYTGTDPDGKSDTGKWTLDGKDLKMVPDKDADPDNQPKVTLNDEGTRMHAEFSKGTNKMEMDLVHA